ncbi:ABC transporter substrate-binding protein [Jeotgalibacillus proteolyticus]|uniref:Iron siderophore-binding protein n=1 Tax=Jeotgalibacillus proteolyticus TaxID=2082395 RepID=A0A2S5GC74_9BACL|nr:iron-siderophore ABC transporter substrate-binding protein [Jeotgalibacillus proteolyticus]PPA70610.1 iron siderophore-binding protein [Jeotgalibacillus proteolyticus]
MKKNLFLFLLIGILAIVMAACSSNDNGAGNEESDNSSGDTEESYTIEHAMGEATIEGTPERVVILTNEGTEALLSMGVTPVGAVQSWTGDPWYEHIAEDMTDVEVVGTESEVNVEAIAALQPDLIIGTKLRQEAVYEQLEQIAPTVMSETLKGDWQENFELYSKAINKEEEGQQVMDDYKHRVEELSGELGEQVENEISMVRFMAGDTRIYHKDSFSGLILDQLGFARPEEQDIDDFSENGVTKERVEAMEGDVLFYFTYEEGDGEGSKAADSWLNDPLFQNLEVVKEGNIHEVSDTIWNTAGGVRAANLMLDDIEEYFLN